MTNTNSDTAVYVESDALSSWSGELDSINETAVAIIESFESTIKDLDNYWIGNSADGFKTAMTTLMTTAKNRHNSMKNVSALLNEVVVAIQNQ